MKKQSEKTILQHGVFKIIKRYDYWGSWEYVMLKDGNFVDRSSSLETLKDKAYAN